MVLEEWLRRPTRERILMRLTSSLQSSPSASGSDQGVPEQCKGAQLS